MQILVRQRSLRLSRYQATPREKLGNRSMGHTHQTRQRRHFLKTKARRVLLGVQDRQKNDQHTDSPAASRSGQTSSSGSSKQGVEHIPLGPANGVPRYNLSGSTRNGHPPFTGARMKKPAYGLNDAPYLCGPLHLCLLRQQGHQAVRSNSSPSTWKEPLIISWTQSPRIVPEADRSTASCPYM